MFLSFVLHTKVHFLNPAVRTVFHSPADHCIVPAGFHLHFFPSINNQKEKHPPIDWKAAVRTWEKRETMQKGGNEFADVI